MKQTWEKGEKITLGPILVRFAQIWGPNMFLWVLPLLDVRHCHKLSSYAISSRVAKFFFQKSGLASH